MDVPAPRASQENTGAAGGDMRSSHLKLEHPDLTPAATAFKMRTHAV